MTKRQWIWIVAVEAVGAFVALFAGVAGLILVPEAGLFGGENSTGDRLAGTGFLVLAAVAAVSGWLLAARMRRSKDMALAAAVTAAALWGAALAFGIG
jgi:hypothetical protein